MISKSSILALLIRAMTFTSHAAASPEETHVTRVQKAYESLATDFDAIRDLYDGDAVLKFCWGGSCREGSVDDIILPFHQSLKTFQCQTTPIAGENEQVMSLSWNDYVETKDGCSQVTHGIATFEFNENHKVVKHLSLSDDQPKCVNEHNEGVDTSANIH